MPDDEGHAGPAMARASPHLAGRAFADEPHRIDRFDRSTGRDRDVATVEVCVASLGDDRRAVGSFGRSDRSTVQCGHDGVDDVGRLRQAALTGLAGRERPLSGSTIR